MFTSVTEHVHQGFNGNGVSQDGKVDLSTYLDQLVENGILYEIIPLQDGVLVLGRDVQTITGEEQ